jgi:hypothetical protein
MLVLGAISALTAGGFYVAKRTTSQEKAQTAVQTARTLSNVLAQSWGQSGSFSGIQSSAVAQQAPQFAHAGALVDSWGGPIDFSATPDGTAYAMTFDGVPSDACVRGRTHMTIFLLLFVFGLGWPLVAVYASRLTVEQEASCMRVLWWILGFSLLGVLVLGLSVLHSLLERAVLVTFALTLCWMAHAVFFSRRSYGGEHD